MNKNLNKSYDPKLVEDKIYDFWQSNGYFKASNDRSKKPYTIVIPPPNVTGKLHMGHALDETLQDILIRFKRMQGFNALWIPGTDHAAIATEAKIVEAMNKEGIKKEQIGRDTFLKRAFDWKKKYGSTIIEQIKKLGASCDWSRERFTMDSGCSKAVKEVFVRLYEKGLIYRGERIINWCPKCKTSISDAEVEFSEKDGHLWYINYPLSDKTGFIKIATTRPETLLGDTAIAVNPNDDRYKSLIGKNAIIPLINREIPIIADDYVEPDFGTGAVKITPAHDPNDFEVGLRHSLPIIDIMNDDATLNQNSGKYQNLAVSKAREIIVNDLKEGNFLTKIERIHHNVGTCYRCHETIEPKVSMQWFVKMEPLAKPAIECVKSGKTKFVPQRFEKIYFNWLNNIKDWCISRQLWWGHQIPAFYCQDCGEIIVSKENVNYCPKCKSNNIKQDEDTLDTWFSSALWPFSVFGWPERNEDLNYFYPTSTLVTGYDIIFFWVVRMIFSAIEHTGKAPFENVLIHGLVRDSKGRKMSKSLGNGVDPIEIIKEYGTDALRFSLISGNSPGNDIRFSDEKVSASRNFANKIWNAARFILMKMDSFDVKNEIPPYLQIEDKWILSKLNNVTLEVTSNLENLELGVAAQKLYDFIWDDFCDWYIEFAKIRLQDDNFAKNTLSVLVYTMSQTLKLLHPFMPFITEEIWRTFPHDGDSIMVSEYPKYDKNLCFINEQNSIEIIMRNIRAIRNRRAEMNVSKSKKTSIYIATENSSVFEKGKVFFKNLAYADKIEISNSYNISDVVTIVTQDAKIYIPMNELIDKEAEIIRLKKELDNTKKQFEQAKTRIENKEFMSKAPENVVKTAMKNYTGLNNKITSLNTTIAELQK